MENEDEIFDINSKTIVDEIFTELFESVFDSSSVKENETFSWDTFDFGENTNLQFDQLHCNSSFENDNYIKGLKW